MKNRPNHNETCSRLGLRGLFNHLLGRRAAASAKPTKARLVKVWDGQRGNYRDVDLHDRNDPLWAVARELYLLSKTSRHKSAA